MGYVREVATIGGREISIETGKWAKQAAGAVVVRQGDTMVLVTATGSSKPRETDFMPLTCEYQEKFYASGRIPGSYFRREGRPSEAEILVCRLMDRPVRPLFPDSWRIDTQVIATVVSFDEQNPSDVLAMIGASAAVHLSDLVWAGPIAGVRVARVDGQFIAFPTFAEREQSDMDLLVAASRESIVMVEGGMRDIPEQVVVDALLFAHQSAQPLLDLQEKLRAAAGKPKRNHVEPTADPLIVERVRALTEPVRDALGIREKHERYGKLNALVDG
ncbi:MAG TPA: polyribonucleotide nucleotidyltransferase, partial [Kofleriaceae bacterium]|nr:polyribonucleotide nucleotidyltransferase [Kofleriaceae bacterium]